MDEFKEQLISLLHYPDISWNTVFQILKKDPTLRNIYQLQKQSPQQTFLFPPLATKNTSEKPSNIPLHPDIILDQIRQYKTNEITVITIIDKEYPPLLKEIYQPPWALFTKGDLSLLEKSQNLR